MLNMLNIYKDGWNENNAYIFGFIMADGCLLPYKKNEKIVMSSNDLDLLEDIKIYIKEDRKIYKTRNSFQLYYTNQEAISFMKNNKLVSRKSKIVEFPDIPFSLYGSFIRGYFDGNGSIIFNETKNNTYPQVSISSGSRVFLDNMSDVLNINSIPSYVYVDKPFSSFSLKVNGINNCNKFYDFMYPSSNIIKLNRKHNKFNKIKKLSYKYNI